MLCTQGDISIAIFLTAIADRKKILIASESLCIQAAFFFNIYKT